MKCEEEESLNDPEVYKQEGNFGLNEDGPELPQIKEEQEEVCTSQDVVQVVVKQESEEIFVWTGKEQFRVLDNIWEREKDLHCTDSWQICNQERNSSLDLEDTDPSQTKEEQEEMSINQEGKLSLKQETKDIIIWTGQELGIKWNPEVKLHIIAAPELLCKELHAAPPLPAVQVLI
ncbi:uncharacterized protein LOC116309821 isoform X2 [Oreochromis aureus]|uniref:uncharacterized protein LOC116309821 isoform X2 n=1 Tax=Oreochromis aureus TaxID=47969 RepID=UPI001954AE13|nr:uncharacterized protein LOC116309821 isoform X2 [Oreochromis aureus]